MEVQFRPNTYAFAVLIELIVQIRSLPPQRKDLTVILCLVIPELHVWFSRLLICIQCCLQLGQWFFGRLLDSPSLPISKNPRILLPHRRLGA